MGRVEFGPREGESDFLFHRRLLGQASNVLGKHPERPAQQRIDAVQFPVVAFGTVPGAAEAASRTSGWVARARAEFARVQAEVTDLHAGTQRAIDAGDDGVAASTAVARGATLR